MRANYYHTEPTDAVGSNKEFAHGIYTTISKTGTSTTNMFSNIKATKVFFYPVYNLMLYTLN